MNLLIIDDDFALLQGLQWALGENYTVFAFSSAWDALAAWDAVQPDAVLTDYEMNGLSGLEVARAVKLNYPQVPVVLMSAALSHELLIKAKGAGICSCWSKPFDVVELKEFLKKLTYAEGG